MVAQNVFHQASSHQIIDLWRFADGYGIPWNLHTHFRADLIATILQTYLLPLCVFQQSHLVSDLCGVDVQWLQERSSQALPNSKELSGVNFFRLPIRLQELLQAPLCFLRSFCFARTRLDPLSSQVLHHDCISIVSRFTTFTENFVICRNQVTNIFCTRYSSAIASYARGPCDFGPMADLAISVFREVSINAVFTQIRTSRRL